MLHHAKRPLGLIHGYHVTRAVNLDKVEKHVDLGIADGTEHASLDFIDIPGLVVRGRE